MADHNVPLYDSEGEKRDLGAMPIAARRALMIAGEILTAEGWKSLTLGDRRSVVMEGAKPAIDRAKIQDITHKANPPSDWGDAVTDPPVDDVPASLLAKLGDERPLELARWAALRPLDRFAFVLIADEGPDDRLARFYDGLFRKDEPRPQAASSGHFRMVSTHRAVASARVQMRVESLALFLGSETTPEAVFAMARIAGIQAGKHASQFLPMCYPSPITKVDVICQADYASGSILIKATVDAVERSGVDTEAMVAATVAALTIVDFAKQTDRGVAVTDVQLVEEKDVEA
jgi:cyclic pyranopterin phosphate synthase